ncbi:MAG: DUF2194 domain-containing protein [Lachnospiraceae bacterium]|nr:DUF2194 domain-containing protein [Lachnospiraceae bacterium]
MACFTVLGVFMFEVSSGMNYQQQDQGSVYLPFVSQENREEWDAQAEEADCMLIMDSAQQVSVGAVEQFRQIFKDMKVSYDLVDLKKRIPTDYDGYKTVVLTISQLGAMGDRVLTLSDWVKGGGRVLSTQTLEVDDGFRTLQNKIGIKECSGGNGLVDKLVISEKFMIGADTFGVEDAYESALNVSLQDDCTVYMTTDGAYPIPLVWENSYGKGKFVIDNFGLCEKATRGFFAASYSLLEDVCLYPVIDASLFYIDDFPSPVPSGDGQYIREQYNMNVADFYANVWWPDMIHLSKTYGVKYSGMIIENYEDQVSGELKANTDSSRYHFFGDMLMSMGGELGIHGYNHQPLCLNNMDYEGETAYETWPSEKSMENAVKEVLRFAKDLFPEASVSTYVPPSNILSEEGRELLVTKFPQIKNIASIYFPGEQAYEQEFEVAEDGMIEVPRVISGCNLTDYMKMAAVSELNMHYISSHFLHPDDLLDPDRGAALGWETLKAYFTEYLDWLCQAAPGIRSLTGSEGAGAVQRFYQVDIDRVDEADGISLELNGFVDEAYLMMRVNAGEIGTVTGAELEHITGNLYLLHATADRVELNYAERDLGVQ